MFLLGEKIKEIRRKAKISQKELAELSGISFNTVVNIESGKNDNPTVQSIYRMAKALQVRIEDLFIEVKTMQNQKYLPLYERDLPPFPILLLANAYTKHLEEIIQDKWSFIPVTMHRGYGSWFFGEKDLQRIGQRCFYLLKKDNNFLKKLDEKFIRLVKRFIHTTAQLTTLHYGGLTRRKIIDLFEDFCSQYQHVCAYGEIIPFALEQILTDSLHAYLSKKFVGMPQEERSQVFSILATFTQTSFVAKEEVALYRIGLLPRSQRKKMLARHYNTYRWVPFDYVGPAWNNAYFDTRLQEINSMSRLEVKNKLKELESRGKSLEADQQKIIKKYNFAQKEISEFSFLQQCTLLYDHKKEYLTQAHYHFSFLVQEIARRLKIDFALLYYALPQEIIHALEGKKILNNKLLAHRKESSVMITHNGETRYLNTKEIHEWLPYLERGKKDISETEVYGLVAQSGKITGRISKILSYRHIGNMRKGDILLTTMTTVDFVPAMRLASAIVTDLGGITCHAAIVSRELGIPCVVGTKKATSVFQDGDTIDVDAEKGKVTLIKRS